MEKTEIVEVKKENMIVQKIEGSLNAAEQELIDVERELQAAEDELKALFSKKQK